MNNIIKYSTIALSTLLVITISQANEDTNITKEKHEVNTTKSSHHAHSAHWGYMGENGPTHWADVKAEFNMCSEGKVQTPINVVATKNSDLKPLELNYTVGAKNIINNGHSVQINIKDGNIFKLDGLDYKLKQFHFHVPSENNINGQAYPLEAHFVHATDDGKLAVIAVMFKEGATNAILTKAWKNISNLKLGEAVESTLTIEEINALMPNNKEYYKFMGSLTTPPCSEGVKWFVYKHPLTVSKAQINSFFNLFSFPNNRPIQPSNNRVIEE